MADGGWSLLYTVGGQAVSCPHYTKPGRPGAFWQGTLLQLTSPFALPLYGVGSTKAAAGKTSLGRHTTTTRQVTSLFLFVGNALFFPFFPVIRSRMLEEEEEEGKDEEIKYIRGNKDSVEGKNEHDFSGHNWIMGSVNLSGWWWSLLLVPAP
ncbi:hypothetical protein E2C01_089939 [Portunus trituberculatus]|uniref:Uncharacterized protein n=1 Tax=Portunus trituberculatus TaxID=210409 RepID=A0A5B7JJK9_PORTR|nr:hypothetical protein [Portunus trituberculatus]